MKTLPPKLTPRQFVRACELFNDLTPGLTPGEVASMFHRRSLPKWDAVAKEAEDMACELTPDNATFGAHLRRLEVSEWAAAQAKA